MLKKSNQIINVFVKNPTISYLFNEIKDLIKSKSESYTFNSLNYFVKEGVLKKEKRGNINLYKISDNNKAILYLSIVSEFESWKNKNIPLNIITEIINKININYFSLLVTGSYSKGTHNQNSDLDLILIVPHDAKKISSRLRHFCEMSIPLIHLYVFTDDEFKIMLLDKNYNFGKEIVKNNLIFYGAESYYKILFEAMKNGFTY